jgi:hypothetical protein
MIRRTQEPSPCSVERHLAGHFTSVDHAHLPFRLYVSRWTVAISRASLTLGSHSGTGRRGIFHATGFAGPAIRGCSGEAAGENAAFAQAWKDALQACLPSALLEWASKDPIVGRAGKLGKNSEKVGPDAANGCAGTLENCFLVLAGCLVQFRRMAKDSSILPARHLTLCSEPEEKLTIRHTPLGQ